MTHTCVGSYIVWASLKAAWTTRFISPLYVDAIVDAQGSEYQGIFSCSEVDETDIVYMEFVYPSQLQLSWNLPPLPLAQIYIEPLPWRPLKVNKPYNASLQKHVITAEMKNIFSFPSLNAPCHYRYWIKHGYYAGKYYSSKFSSV